MNSLRAFSSAGAIAYMGKSLGMKSGFSSMAWSHGLEEGNRSACFLLKTSANSLNASGTEVSPVYSFASKVAFVVFV